MSDANCARALRCKASEPMTSAAANYAALAQVAARTLSTLLSTLRTRFSLVRACQSKEFVFAPHSSHHEHGRTLSYCKYLGLADPDVDSRALLYIHTSSKTDDLTMTLGSSDAYTASSPIRFKRPNSFSHSSLLPQLQRAVQDRGCFAETVR